MFKFAFLAFLQVFYCSITYAEIKVKCFQIQKGQHLNEQDFVLEASTIFSDHVQKKIFMKNDGFSSHKTVLSTLNFMNQKNNLLYVSDEFLLEFILTQKIHPNSTYKVRTDHGFSYFSIEDQKFPSVLLKIETPNGNLKVHIRKTPKEYQIKKIVLQKSNLTLLPCELHLQQKILQTKEVHQFLGDQVVPTLYK